MDVYPSNVAIPTKKMERIAALYDTRVINTAIIRKMKMSPKAAPDDEVS